jgi:hypothetical protein
MGPDFYTTGFFGRSDDGVQHHPCVAIFQAGFGGERQFHIGHNERLVKMKAAPSFPMPYRPTTGNPLAGFGWRRDPPQCCVTQDTVRCG